MTKTGRKRNDYKDPTTGLPVVGLSRRPDGRWRIIGTNSTFREADPQKAIARYKHLVDPNREHKEKYGVPSYQGSVMDQLSKGFALWPDTTAEDRMWKWIGNQIRERPAWTAKKTGIEQLGYLTSLEPTTDLPTPQQIVDVWTAHAEVKSAERRKVRDAWNDFVDITGITNLRQIKSKLCVEFKDTVVKRGWATKTCLRHFNRVRRAISFQIERGISSDEMLRLLNVLKVLKLKRTKRIVKPNPISRDNFQSLLKVASGADKAMLLLMLNCALYLEEVRRCLWSDITADGCFVAQREKEGQQIRVATLWPETLEALGKIKRREGVDAIFIGDHGGMITVSGAGKRFRKLRKAAGLKDVTGAQLRDGARQAMADANINTDLARLVMGHSNGIDDNYAVRKPSMVAPACDAVRKFYLSM